MTPKQRLVTKQEQQDNIAQLQHERDSLLSRCDRRSTEFREAHNRKIGCENVLSRAPNDHQGQHDLNAVTQQLEQLRHAEAEDKARIAELENDIAQCQQVIADCTEGPHRLPVALAEKQQAEVRIKQIEQQLVTLNDRYAQATTALQERHRTVQDCERRRDQALDTAAMEQAGAALETARTQAENARALSANITRQLKALEQELTQARSQLETAAREVWLATSENLLAGIPSDAHQTLEKAFVAQCLAGQGNEGFRRFVGNVFAGEVDTLPPERRAQLQQQLIEEMNCANDH
ncbi:MAG: hypothetical protein V2J55_01155 [Candidatus Competibacteraceae bacterium]|jgi:chromosome segregation ATPase|nr:hypothetical protein [Candidatus Competibacteraceae bacterium]